MQITQTNFSVPNYTVKRLPQKALYNASMDTFIKSGISFKAAPKNIFQIIKENPNLSQTVMALVTLGASTIALGAESENIGIFLNNDKNAEQKKTFINMLGEMFGFKNESTTNETPQQENINQQGNADQEIIPIEYKEKIEKLEKENAEYLDKINDLENRLKQYAKQETTAAAAGENSMKAQKIEFPKKHGRLTKQQEELKSAVTNINPQGLNADIVIQVCKELLNKGAHENVDNGVLAHNLAQELNENKDNQGKINDIISYYAKKLGLISDTQEPAGENNPKRQNIGEKTSALNNRTNTQEVIGVRVVDKIDLSPIESKKRRPRIPTIEVKNHETLPNTYYYKISGTLKSDIQENLYDLFRCFKRKTIDKRNAANNDKKIKWKLESPLTKRVLPIDIVKELNHNEYKNIKKYNISADTLAEIINSDENYSKIFGLHAALRFLDRFLVLDDCEIPIEKQAVSAIKTLIDTIKYSLRTGVIMEEYTTPYYPNNDFNAEPEMLIGLRLHIPEEHYSKEALDLFGTYPLRIGISGERSYNKKGAVIDTIFKDGI